MSPRKQKYSITEDKALLWAEQHPSVLTYLSKINACQKRAAQDIYLFCEWCGKSPEELLSLKNTYEANAAEATLDEFVRAKVDFPDTRKWQIIQKIRGFYRTNYRALQTAAGKMEYPPGQDQGAPTKKNRRAMVAACYTLRDKAIVMISSCSAMALETLSGLCWSHFEEDWMQQETPHISIPPSLLKGHGKGKYKGVRQETFITPEAKATLLEYRDWFSKTFNYVWRETDHVFLQTKRNIGKPLTYLMIAKAMLKLAKRAGVSVSSHDGRRVVQTALENVGTPNNWIKKIKGRKISMEESPYSKPAIEQLRAKYREALPDLEFLTEQTATITELSKGLETRSSEIADLKAQLATLQEHFEGFIKSGYLIKQGNEITFIAPGYVGKPDTKAALSEEQKKELLKKLSTLTKQ